MLEDIVDLLEIDWRLWVGTVQIKLISGEK